MCSSGWLLKRAVIDDAVRLARAWLCHVAMVEVSPVRRLEQRHRPGCESRMPMRSVRDARLAGEMADKRKLLPSAEYAGSPSMQSAPLPLQSVDDECWVRRRRSEPSTSGWGPTSVLKRRRSGHRAICRGTLLPADGVPGDSSCSPRAVGVDHPDHPFVKVEVGRGTIRRLAEMLEHEPALQVGVARTRIATSLCRCGCVQHRAGGSHLRRCGGWQGHVRRSRRRCQRSTRIRPHATSKSAVKVRIAPPIFWVANSLTSKNKSSGDCGR